MIAYLPYFSPPRTLIHRPFSRADVEGASAREIDEFQGFQEGEPLLHPEEKQAIRPGTRQVHTHEKICDSSRTPTVPLHGEHDPDACMATRKAGVVEHYFKRKRSPEGVSAGGLDRTEVSPLGGRFEAEWRRFVDEGLDNNVVDGEENLLLTMLASGMDSSSPRAPAPASATIVEGTPSGRSNNKQAAEPVPPCSPASTAAAEGELELKTWEAEGHDWEGGAGTTPRVDSPDLSSPPRPRRPGNNVSLSRRVFCPWSSIVWINELPLIPRRGRVVALVSYFFSFCFSFVLDFRAIQRLLEGGGTWKYRPRVEYGPFRGWGCQSPNLKG